MPTDEEQIALEQLNQLRMQEEMQAQESEQQTPVAPPKISFPWGMFLVAIIFDLIGLIPIVNIASEVVARLLFWLWQKTYIPDVDPFIATIVSEIIKWAGAGFLPSNIEIVIYSYFKKKAASKISPHTLTGATATAQ